MKSDQIPNPLNALHEQVTALLTRQLAAHCDLVDRRTLLSMLDVMIDSAREQKNGRGLRMARTIKREINELPAAPDPGTMTEVAAQLAQVLPGLMETESEIPDKMVGPW